MQNYRFGFDKVAIDETDSRDEWQHEFLRELNIPASEFEAWITATDAPPDLQKLGPSVCAWQIREKGSVVALPPERWPGRPVESDESKGFVAAVAGVLDRLPVGSKVTFFCRQKWIRDAINGRLEEWERKGELSGKRRYWRIWRQVLDRIRAIAPDRAAVKAEPPTAEGEKIINALKDWAREVRPHLDEAH